MLHRWRNLHPWLRAAIEAAVILAVLHVCVVRWVTVRHTSMYATLLPGDLLLVERWPLLTGVDRGDVVVFRDPLKDKQAKWRRPLLVKRIAGMPGDELHLRDGVLFINGERQAFPHTATFSHLVRLKQGRSANGIVELLGLPPTMAQDGRTIVELPLNPALADTLRQLPDVVHVERMSSATGAPRHIFPFSPRYRWNSDDYGPLRIPKKGDTLHITIDNLPLYDRLISHYEGHTLGVSGKELTIDGQPLDTYVVEQDHYFVLGDNRHYSSDSRYWGFVPSDHLVGRAGLVALSKGATPLPRGRWLH